MARRKNVKRIDPRYFLHETVNRGEDLGAPLQEDEDPYGGYMAQADAEAANLARDEEASDQCEIMSFAKAASVRIF